MFSISIDLYLKCVFTLDILALISRKSSRFNQGVQHLIQVLMYNKQVLCNSLGMVYLSKYKQIWYSSHGPYVGILRSEREIEKEKKHLSFLSDDTLLQTPLMFRSKWNSPKVNVNYMTAICLYQNTTKEFHFSLQTSYWRHLFTCLHY